jgi:elongation factor P hydroxylase
VTAVVAHASCVGADFDPRRLEQVFARCFAAEFRTRLCGGAREPLYQPAGEVSQVHLLWYREDYFASALHEVAHWCIAGEQRRQQLDFGYWYAPDGRSPEQQGAFEAVEYKPQALEWFFSLACGYRFRLSADNLGMPGGEMPDASEFRGRVCEQARYWQSSGLPARAGVFYRELCREFANEVGVNDLHFCEEQLL